MVKLILISIALFLFIRFIFKIFRAIQAPMPNRKSSSDSEEYTTVDWETQGNFAHPHFRKEKDISNKAKIIED